MNPVSAPRRVLAIVPAAGRGSRFAASGPNAAPKQYAPLRGATVIEYSLRALLAEPRIDAVVVALASDDAMWPQIATKLANAKLLNCVGGANRQDSVLSGLEFLAGRAAADDWVLVHDAARPCLDARDLGALLDAVLVHGASGAVLAAPLVDTIKRQQQGAVSTVDRQGLWRALTPQVFAFAALRGALQDTLRAGAAVTDEAQAMERAGVQPALVAGSPLNVKVTTTDDLQLAAKFLSMGEGMPMRIGQGFDVHAFGEGDHVMLGGVRIAHGRGIVAHSDGDVVIHALCDALLGAMGDGDIGQHFPDTDPRYRGADSRVFLRTVAERMRAAGFKLANADVTVLAEAPRLAAHRVAMASTLAADIGVEARLVNIKATTTERMGFVGRGEGIAALVSVLLAPVGD